jgi:ribose transport system permease protein
VTLPATHTASEPNQTDDRARAPVARVLNLHTLRNYGILGALIVLFVVLTLSSSVFLTSSNISNILVQWTPVGIIAFGSTLVFVGGGFDLSVAAVYALSGVVAAKVSNSSGADLGLIAGCGLGAAVGLLNGVLVTVGRINAFIATLATSIIVGGIGLAVTNGTLITVNSQSFGTVGNNSIIGVPITIWLLGATALVLAVVLHRTIFGRHIFAVGGNIEAAKLSGLPVGWVRIGTFVICGLCAGIAGVIAASTVLTGNSSSDINITFDAIVAVVLGGTSLFGGEGAIWRTVTGLLVLALIGNGFNLLAVNPVYQSIIYGSILLAAVAVDAWSRGTEA